MGCGWGRHFPLYEQFGVEIYGVDISSKMIEEARKNYKNTVVNLEVSTAEKLPFDDGEFDFLCCLGVFDATYQEVALAEMLRVVKLNGRIVVTGKNANYCLDDDEASAAEVGARNKGEPNYFTDTPLMIKQLEALGHTVKSAYYFKRRGDFTNKKFVTEMPAKFYEYLLIIEKGSNNVEFTLFSNPHSFVE